MSLLQKAAKVCEKTLRVKHEAAALACHEHMEYRHLALLQSS